MFCMVLLANIVLKLGILASYSHFGFNVLAYLLCLVSVIATGLRSWHSRLIQ